MEWIIHIQMNPEKWFIRHRIQLTIKRFVVLIRKFTWFACPQRSSIINDIIFGCFYLFAIFPFFFLSKGNRNRKETAIFFQKLRYTGFFKKLFAVIINV